MDVKEINPRGISEKDKLALQGILGSSAARAAQPTVIDYNEMMLEKKSKIKEERYKNAMDVLNDALLQYNRNYPNSNKNLEWKKSKSTILLVGNNRIKEELNQMSEAQLFQLQEVFDYCKMEGYATSEKAINNINWILKKIKKKIPGFEKRVLLKKIEEQESDFQLQKKKLQEVIELEKIEFSKRLDIERNKPPIIEEPIKKEDIKKPSEFFCTKCNKPFKSQLGFNSHNRQVHNE